MATSCIECYAEAKGSEEAPCRFAGGTSMEAITGAFVDKTKASLEKVFRYFMSGVVFVAGAYISHPEAVAELVAIENVLIQFVVVMLVGMLGYAIYRSVAYCTIERFADLCGLSAPSSFKTKAWWKPQNYPRRYAEFLRMRHIDLCHEKVSSYLFLRWSYSHFIIIVGLVATTAAMTHDDISVLASHPLIARAVLVAGFVLVVIGFLQQVFLFRVEKCLFGKHHLLKPVESDIERRACGSSGRTA